MAINPSTLLPSQTDAPSADYPLGQARNVVVTGDGTGTPWEKDIVNDLWGFFQAALAHAGITASGNPDKVGASQYLESVQKIAGYPGEVVPWMGNATNPGTLGIRLLPLEGQGVLRTAYPDLDTATYVGDESNPDAPAFYRSSTPGGSPRDVGGEYLILPDLRGFTLRGLDESATYDPDGATRGIGSQQNFAMMEHVHYVWAPGGGGYYPNQLAFDVTPGGTPGYQLAELTSGVEGLTDLRAETIPTFSVPTANQSPDEVRMYNVSCRWCIRY